MMTLGIYSLPDEVVIDTVLNDSSLPQTAWQYSLYI